jgi:hypothetical protein
MPKRCGLQSDFLPRRAHDSIPRGCLLVPCLATSARMPKVARDVDVNAGLTATLGLGCHRGYGFAMAAWHQSNRKQAGRQEAALLLM